MNLFKDFADFITLLQKYKVNYLIVGGYAVGIYSRPRATGDIDFWIGSDKENAKKLTDVLKEFGFSDIDFTIDEITSKDQLLIIGREPIRIDIITSISGVEFNEAFQNKITHDFGSVKAVNFISLNDLLKNKKASGREKDKQDLNWLKTYGKDN